MKNSVQESRRNFLTTSIKGAAMMGAGAVIMGIPLKSLAHSSIDAGYLDQIASIGTTSLETSRLALRAAVNPLVQLFAKFEKEEQEAVGGLLGTLGVIVPSPHPADPDVLRTLRGLNGPAFDKTYMVAQVKGHHRLKDVVGAYFQSTDNAYIKHVVNLALATIGEHIDRGEMLLRQLP
jgi:putative membrane protein